QARIGLERRARARDPIGIEHTIAIHELHELEPAVELDQPAPTLIARAGGGEGRGGVELDHLEAAPARARHAAVAGARVDVHRAQAEVLEGRQAALEALALVAPDDDDAERAAHAGPPGRRSSTAKVRIERRK